MRRCPESLRNGQSRSGKILALFVLMLTCLLGMVGLVIDTGMLMAGHRTAQNAADAGAMAAAMELYLGNTQDQARTMAETFVQQYNGLANATVTVNFAADISALAASEHRTDRYVEVLVTNANRTYFIHLVGIGTSQNVQARAVAGFENLTSGEGAIVLDPNARPGLEITGGASLVVNGSVLDNSRGAGEDQYGQNVDWGYQKYAMTTSNNSTVKARAILVRGGVDTPANYQSYEEGGPSPLFARARMQPDPLRDLPAPQQNNVSSISNWTRQPAVTVATGETRTFSPGVYEDIQINGGSTVTFNPGVYIFSPTSNNQGLRINGAPTVTGDGVMFYMTGSNYLNNTPGHWDAADDAQNALDGPLPPTNGGDSLPAAADPQFGQVKMSTLDINTTGGNVTLKGLKDPNSPFNDLLFFQRRRNANGANIQGNAGENVLLSGTIYAKWAKFKLAGGGRYDARFVVGSMQISGQANVTINDSGKNFGQASKVFLVE